MKTYHASRIPTGWKFAGYAAAFTQGGVDCDPRSVNVRIAHEESGEVDLLRMWRKSAERLADELLREQNASIYEEY